MGRKLLVIISGAPGAGKTTLARRLGEQLSIPVLSKDRIKEAMGEHFPEIDLGLSRQLGRAAFEVLYAMAAAVLGASSVIIEGNFQHGYSEADIRPLLHLAEACELNCQLAAELCVERYALRTQSGQRHRVHLDALRLSVLEEGLQRGLYAPLELDTPQLIVDTSEGYMPELESVVEFVRGLLVRAG
ncbi:MAG: AAA family ATPase [Chloroflexi bacterium]|nr:AAA family ATPase [Chloroflexota bacterium]